MKEEPSTPSSSELYAFYKERYACRQATIATTGGRKEWLGKPAPRVCRYCDKSPPDVSFSQEAHAIPQFLGNRKLMDNFECDTCNKYFSETAEDSLAKFLGPYRAAAGIRGQKGYTKAKSGDNSLSFSDSGGTLIGVGPEADGFTCAEDGRMRMDMDSGPYVPQHLYRCMTKIAIALLDLCPSEWSVGLTQTKRWLLGEPAVGPCSDPPMLHLTFMPGIPSGYLRCWLLHRLPGRTDVPSLPIVVSLGSLCLQAAVPYVESDHCLKDKKVSLPAFPVIDPAACRAPPSSWHVDCSSVDPTRSRQHPTFQFPNPGDLKRIEQKLDELRREPGEEP